MSNEQIAKPILIEIEGDHYEFTPLNISDITGPVTDYLKLAPVASLMKQRDALDPEIYDEMLSDVKEESSKIELGTTVFSNEIGKPKNLFYMFWLSLRKKHPTIKKSEFDKMILANPEAAVTLVENLSRIIAIADSTPVDETETEEEDTRKKVEGTKKKIALST